MNQILDNLEGKAKVNRYRTKSTVGEDMEVADISDDKGFYTSRLLRFKDMFHNGQERRTQSYYAERDVKPASIFHKSTGHLKDL